MQWCVILSEENGLLDHTIVQTTEPNPHAPNLLTDKCLPVSFHSSHGKTTLLRHIASRAFPIPPSIDILYCEQEVVANDNPAVEEVLKADVKRTSLLEECKKLDAELEKGNMGVQARLKEVQLQVFELKDCS